MDTHDYLLPAAIVSMVLGSGFALYLHMHRVDFWKDGRAYQVRSRCVRQHTDQTYDYHYGFNPMTAKFEFHFGPNSITVCDEYHTDTLEVKHPLIKSKSQP